MTTNETTGTLIPAGCTQIGHATEERQALYLDPDGPAGMYSIVIVWNPDDDGATDYEIVFMLEPREAAAIVYPIANAGGGGIIWPRMTLVVDWEYGLDGFGNDCALSLATIDEHGAAIAIRIVPIRSDLFAEAIYGALGI